MWQDLVNGLLEVLGGGAVGLSVLRLMRDRRVAGVDWRTSAFFMLWGIWNLYYYPSLGQYFSGAGAFLVVVAHATWLLLYHRFRRNP